MIYNETRYNSHWNTKKLTDLGVFSRGKSKHRPRDDERLYEGGGYPLIQTGEVKAANLYITKHEQEYGEFGLAQSKLWDAGTLCITIAANIAETAILSYPMCFPDSVVGFRAYPEESSELFMHYVFTYIRNSIQNSVSGSIQDNINIDYLSQLDFKVPDKAYQNKVVGILGAIDQKIDTNNRICEELESMAKTIYDYWFTQFDFPDADGKPYRSSGGAMEWNAHLGRLLPKDWKVHYLSEIFDTKLGGTPDTKEESFWNGDIPWLSSSEVAQSPILSSEKTITSQGMKCSSTSFAEKGTVLLSITRYIRPAILGIDACFNQSVVAIIPNKKYRTEYLYQVILAQVDRYMTLRRGAQQPHINKEIVDKTLVICPPNEILQKYYDVVAPLYSMHMNAAKENRELTKLRDWLLPMLMNGQATVK